MKTVIYSLLLYLVAAGQPVNAQNGTIEKQKIEYAKGNRELVFLKGYIEALKSTEMEDSLSGVVDEYLMVLPLKERYSGESLNYFLEYIKSPEAKSLVEIVKNWENIALNETRREQIVAKIDDVCKVALFQALCQERGCPDVDCSAIQEALGESAIPIPAFRRSLIDMWQGWRTRKVEEVIQAFGRMLSRPMGKSAGEKDARQPDLMFDGSVLGNMLNFILENCDLAQCSRILGMMDQVAEKNSREGLWEIIGKARDNFEGKKMMLEMGEE